MMRMNRLTPKMKELEKRHEGNQRKYQEEVSKLYKEEHVNPMSGCLWSLIPFPILLALYRAIRFPLTTMMGVPKALLEEGGAIALKLEELGFSSSASSAYIQLAQSEFITEHFDQFSGLSDKLVDINYKFLGLNIGDMPQWNFFTKCDWSVVSSWLPALGLFLIPVISAFLSWLSMKVSQSATPATGSQAQAQAQMKSMNLMMPLVSLYICFIMPAALGIYWIFNSLLAIIQELILNKHYKKIMDKEDAERLERDKLREAELERKRQETERLKAEGATTVNTNTSKKKIQAKQKAELDELRAAAIREEKAKRRERLGITEEEKPDSQVGNRRYARGRAYVADRFTNPEAAAEATAAAAAESEFGASIDEEFDAAETAESVDAVETETAASTLTETADDAEEAEDADDDVDELDNDDEEVVEEEQEEED
jgi:YidC/Oxa1 family membrane protein insertase